VTFVKGVSGNPGGRPKGKTFGSILAEVLDSSTDGDTRTVREKIVSVAVGMALDGNLPAIQWVVDRTDGKLKDEHTGELIVRVLRDRAG
jgi:hypothetical protein